MRFTAVLILILCSFGVGLAVPQDKPTVKRTAVKKKKRAAPKKIIARRTRPAPTPSPLVRASANNAVTEWLSTPGIMENPSAMIPFFEQAFRLERGDSTGVLRIFHYGDSHTAADEWTGTMRYLLQARFGDGGNGFSHAGHPWNGYRRMDLKSYSTAGWYSDGLNGRDGDGMYGLSGVSMSTARANEMISLQTDCETAELHYLRQPGGGSIEISDNGSVLETVSTDGDAGPANHPLRLIPGSHLLAARTLSNAPVRLFGWVTENSRGVTYETMGINGAQASIGMNWNPGVLAQYFEERPPALIVLAYGTNEARNKDWTFASYKEMFTALLIRFRQLAPAASILVVGPPDHEIRTRSGWMPHEKIDMILNAQREATLASGCSFWDIRARMGGKGAMRNWVLAGMAQGDYVHFTGQGYRLLGAALYKEIMSQFGAFVRLRGETPEQKSAALNKELNGQAIENH